MILLLLALQDTSASVATTAPRPALLDIDFDLAKPRRASPDPNEIVITARRNNPRLLPLPEIREELLPKAQIDLGGGKLGITTEASALPGGVTSKRIMLKWKLKF